jgi:hypothetical protein
MVRLLPVDIINGTGYVPIAQEHLRMLAGTKSGHTADDVLRHRIATDTVATPEHGERAQRMQRIAEPAEHFPTQRQTGTGDAFEAVLQRVQVGVQPLPTHTWVEFRQ